MIRKTLIIYIFSLLFAGSLILPRSEEKHLSQISDVFPNQETTPLPDLSPFAIYDLRLATLNSRKILKFSASFVNKGKRQFELIGDPNVKGDGYRNVYQRTIKDDGSFQDKIVGNFEWHEAHDHYHYGDFAEYVFGPVKLALSNSKAPLAIRQKTTFCLRDNELAMPDLEGAPVNKGFVGCNQTRQGVSVGWTDIYKYDLPDQYIDVHDMPAGTYQLSFFLDSNQRFSEESKENNISTVFFELNPAKNLVKQIASAAPFSTHHNNFPNGFLIYIGGDTKVYIIHGNKKRWLKTAEIFNSYNYPWDQIYRLTKSMVNAIPNNNLIRLIGTEEVYAINDMGYKRHILNPEIFNSYRFTPADIADINQTEFATYPDTNLIMLSGDEKVYTISGTTKKMLTTFNDLKFLGYDQAIVHIINQTDFESYTTLP